MGAKKLLALDETRPRSLMLRHLSDREHRLLELAGLVSLLPVDVPASPDGASALGTWVAVPASAAYPSPASSEPTPLAPPLDAIEGSVR